MDEDVARRLDEIESRILQLDQKITTVLEILIPANEMLTGYLKRPFTFMGRRAV